MSAIASTPPAMPPAVASPAPAGAAPPERTGDLATNPDFENNLNRFRELAAIVLDTSGTYSESAKVEAWSAQHRMGVVGQLRGLGAEDRELMNQVYRSETYQNIEAARVRYMNTVIAAVKAADAAGTSRAEAVGKAALQHYDGLPGLEQERLFASINAPDYTGATPYANVDAWRGQMMSWAKLFEPISDRLDLSSEAKARVGVLAPSRPDPYAPGALARVEA